MEPIVNKYLDFSSRNMPENRFNSIYIEKYVNLFNAIRQNIKNGNLTNVIKGKGQFSTFKYTHPGSFAMPHENTNISSLFSIFYILIDNGDLKKEAITNSLIGFTSCSAKCLPQIIAAKSKIIASKIKIIANFTCRSNIWPFSLKYS